MEIVQNLFRTLMFFLDNIVYGLIPQIYKLFVYLSELNLYSSDGNNPIQVLISRIYVLLGIFMLFKVSFSLLQYIVDPSAFRDSSKGMGKLVTNVLVALVLLVTVPSIFRFATDIQTTVVSSNVIGELILGKSMSDGETEMSPEYVETLAKDVQFMMFGAFYSLNPAVTDGDNTLFSSCVGTSGVFGSREMVTADGCLEQIDKNISEYDDTSANGVDLYSFFKYAGQVDRKGNRCVNGICDERDFSHFDKLLWWKDNGNYVINYLPFISTAAGIYVVFLLISFCVDVAVRVIKLCFLQMIAPIAIVSYIDPKESIGSGKLNSWVKETASTYFSLFLRLATLFLVMLLISMISSMVLAEDGSLGVQINEITGNDIGFNIWIYLFLVIGAFMFAKQVPKIIESIFGIKGSGEFSLNPFKTYSSVRDSGFGALAGMTVGAGLGAVASGAAAFSATRDEGGKMSTSIRRGVGGFTSGVFRGGYTGFKSGGKQTVSKSLDVAGRVGRNAALKTNTTLTQRLGAYGRQAIGMQSKKEGLDKQIGYHKAVKEHKDNLENIARGKLSKRSSNWKWVQQERDNLQQAVKEQKDLKLDVKDKDGKVVSSRMVHYGDTDYQEAFNQKLDDFYASEKQMVKTYVDTNGRVMDGVDTKEEDYQVTLEKTAFKDDIKNNRLTYEDEKGNNIIKNLDAPTWDEIDEVGKIAEERAARIEKSSDYQDAKTLEESLHSENRQSFWSKQ